MQHAIVCNEVSKTFAVRDAGLAWRVLFGLQPSGPRIEALREITLAVPKGKIVGILGRNGAGKSTLLRVVGGVYPATSGIVRVQGDLASLFELGGLGGRFITGREYASRALGLRGISRSEAQQLLHEIAEFSELGSQFDRRIVTYSSGMAARLYFATATALPSQVYLIDEVLSVGDAHFSAKCWRRLRERLTQGASGLLVTHDWSAVLKLCEQCYVLDRGRIATFGPSDKVVAEYLRLPKPETRAVRFLLGSDHVFRGQSGEDTVFEIPISVANKGARISFAYSIELLRIGVGWEILLLSRFESIDPGRDQSVLRLHIPALPLSPGQYVLNLFLRSTGTGTAYSAGGSEALDVRSWTHGNGVPLEVSGPRRDAAIRLPLSWKVQ